MSRKILVTGGAGFIGHHFIGYLLGRTDWSVVCMDRLDPAGDLNRLSQVGSGPAERRRLAVCYHDLRAEVSQEVARAVITGNGAFDPSPFDYVVHMAAGSHVVRSVADPVGFVMDNVVGTAHLLDFCRKVPGALRHGGRIVYFSTDEVFGPADSDVSFSEWDRFNPNNPYCLPAGTPILMADGSWEPIEEVRSGSLVIGYDFGSRVLKIGTVSSSMMKRGSRLLHLNTAAGIISCSPDHRVFRLPVHRYPSGKISKECVLGDLAAEEIRASDVQVGDFVSVLRTVPEPSDPVRFDSEFARFLGYFAGDGYLHYNRRLKAWDVRLADQSRELLEKYEEILRNVVERHYGRKLKCWYSRHSSKDCWYLCFMCLPLVRQIQNLGLNQKASEKTVPVEIFGWDNKSVAAFLSGLLDADGNVSCSKSRTGKKEYRKICVSYSSASHGLLVSIRLLLRRIGVLCNISRRDKPRRRPTTDHSTYNTWKLSISDSKSLSMLRASIHPFTKPIPVTHSSTPIRLLQNETLVWARVTSVDEKVVNEIMYDLTVPGINNFVADGFVVHNSASKAGGEALCSAYSNTYGLPIVVTHTTNVFGERQHPEKFIPLLVRKILCREVVQIHADKTETKASTRFYTYVDNVSSAVLFLLEHGKCLDGSDSVGKYNISGEREVSNLDLARLVAGMLGRELLYEMVSFCPSRPKHDMRYAIRNELLLSLGWKPEVSFEEGIERTVRYFQG